jgi:hypothetical protein
MNSSVESILVSLVRLVMSGIGCVCIQYFKRRRLAMASGLGMGLTMAIAGTYLYLYGDLPLSDRPFSYIPLVCMLFNVCFSMIGNTN